MYVLKVKSRNREELVEFTDLVREKLKESGQGEGVVVLYVQHTTAGLTISRANFFSSVPNITAATLQNDSWTMLLSRISSGGPRLTFR